MHCFRDDAHDHESRSAKVNEGDLITRLLEHLFDAWGKMRQQSTGDDEAGPRSSCFARGELCSGCRGVATLIPRFECDDSTALLTRGSLNCPGAGAFEGQRRQAFVESRAMR